MKKIFFAALMSLSVGWSSAQAMEKLWDGRALWNTNQFLNIIPYLRLQDFCIAIYANRSIYYNVKDNICDPYNLYDLFFKDRTFSFQKCILPLKALKKREDNAVENVEILPAIWLTKGILRIDVKKIFDGTSEHETDPSKIAQYLERHWRVIPEYWRYHCRYEISNNDWKDGKILKAIDKNYPITEMTLLVCCPKSEWHQYCKNSCELKVNKMSQYFCSKFSTLKKIIIHQKEEKERPPQTLEVKISLPLRIEELNMQLFWASSQKIVISNLKQLSQLHTVSITNTYDPLDDSVINSIFKQLPESVTKLSMTQSVSDLSELKNKKINRLKLGGLCAKKDFFFPESVKDLEVSHIEEIDKDAIFNTLEKLTINFLQPEKIDEICRAFPNLKEIFTYSYFRYDHKGDHSTILRSFLKLPLEHIAYGQCKKAYIADYCSAFKKVLEEKLEQGEIITLKKISVYPEDRVIPEPLPEVQQILNKYREEQRKRIQNQ